MNELNFELVERARARNSRGIFVPPDEPWAWLAGTEGHESPWRYHAEVVQYHAAGPEHSEGQRLSNTRYAKAADLSPAERDSVTRVELPTTGETVCVVATREKARELASQGERAVVKHRRSMAAYNGKVALDWLWIDVDEAGDLDAAHRKTAETLKSLIDYAVPPEAVQIRFSGSKGFHLLFPSAYVGGDVLSGVPVKELSRRLTSAMPRLFPGTDPQVYGPTQLLRMPGTVNPKSGLYCTPLTPEEFCQLTIEEIKDLASKPRPDWVRPAAPPGLTPIPALRQAFLDAMDATETPRLKQRLRSTVGAVDNEAAVDQWLDANGWPHDAPRPCSDDMSIVRLHECPTADRHSAPGGDQGAFLVYRGGGILFRCFHAGCAGNGANVESTAIRRTQEAIERITARKNAPLQLKKKSGLREYAELADEVTEQLFLADDLLTLRSHRGVFYEYQGTGYMELSDEDVSNRVMSWLAENARDSAGITVRDNVVALLRAQGAIPSSVSRGTWVGETDLPGDWKSFRNGILNLDAYLGDVPLEECFLPHSPEFFAPPAVPFEFNPEANCPRFQEFLAEIQPDAESRAVLQGFAGYSLTGDCRHQQFLFLYGRGGNGKNVFGNILAGLHAVEDVAGVPISSFGDRFSLWPLANCRLNYVSELPTYSGQGSVRVAEEKLKAVVSGDMIQVERKHKDAYAVRPTAKLLVLGNELPPLYDRSEGIWRRLLLVHFPVEIAVERQVRNLDRQLLAAEAPGIFNWAMEGLRAVRQRGHIKEPPASATLKGEYRRSMDHEAEFLNDFYRLPLPEEAGKDSLVVSAQMYKDYVEWCKGNGYCACGHNKFGEAVLRVFPQVRRERINFRLNYLPNGKTVVYRGLLPREIPAGEPHVDAKSPAVV